MVGQTGLTGQTALLLAVEGLNQETENATTQHLLMAEMIVKEIKKRLLNVELIIAQVSINIINKLLSLDIMIKKSLWCLFA